MYAPPRLRPGPWSPGVLALVAACADPVEPPPGTTDLLHRRPDSTLVQPGELLPAAEDGWGRADEGGWGQWASRTPSGELVVWTMNRLSHLELAAGPPSDRDLVLRTMAPPSTDLDARHDDGRPVRTFFTVRLNGFELGEVALARELADATVFAPAECWQHGDNLLEFEVNRMSLGESELWHGFGLASVRYDQPIRVESFPEAEQLTLGPQGGVSYTFALQCESKLELGGTAEAPGRLDVYLRSLDASDGRTQSLSDEPVRIEVASALEHTLPLPRVAGEILEVQLQWTSDAAEADLRIERLGLLESEAPGRTPIFFLSVDTLASRNMSLYGYPRPTTPNLEAFAEEAVTFSRCKANAPRTLRSYISQLSGLYPRSHFVENETGRRWRPPVEENQLAPNRWTLAEHLRAAGWRTVAWVDNPWLDNGIGLRQGFDLYDVSACALEHWGESLDPDGGVRHILPLVKEWIDGLPQGEPFFAFLQFLDVHGPYHPIAPWRGQFRGDEHYDAQHDAPVAVDQVDVFGHVPAYVARGEYPDGNLPERMRTGPLVALYDEKILEFDHEIAGFFDYLKERGLYDRSIIVLSADHGESLLEHDFYFGHGTLYEESVNVPLIIRLPGGAHGGRVIDTTVQLVDLYPTIAELAGLNVPGDALHGRSLAPAIRGAELEAVPVLSEGGIMTQYALEYDGWKLIESVPVESSFQTMLSHERVDQSRLDRIEGLREAMPSNRSLREFFERNPGLLRELAVALQGPIRELYHLETDPLEQNDLSREEPERLQQMLALLENERERIEAARALAAPRARPVELSEDEIRKLVELGYLEGDEHLDESGDEDSGESSAGGTASRASQER